MIVLKKINNNVAVCQDGNGRELIAFGRGIGFPPTPYELTDLNKVDRTFYNVSSKYIPLLNDIPIEIVQFTARQMLEIQDKLPYETSANLVLTLADHIAFAIERAGRGIYVQMPSVYEMEMNFPLEVKIGRRFIAAAKRELKLNLPKGEVQGIAMHLINARNAPAMNGSAGEIEDQYEEILEYTTQMIEWELEYVPEGYQQPAQHPGTLEKLEYQTWESFSYAEKSQKLTKTAWVYLPYDYDESKQYNWKKIWWENTFLNMIPTWCCPISRATLWQATAGQSKISPLVWAPRRENA